MSRLDMLAQVIAGMGVLGMHKVKDDQEEFQVDEVVCGFVIDGNRNEGREFIVRGQRALIG